MMDDNTETREWWEDKLQAELSEIKERGWPQKRVKFTDAQLKLIRACQHSGFRVKFGVLKLGPEDSPELQVIVKPKKQGTKVPWKMVNMNPCGACEPDCTTRALAWVFREKWTYAQIRARQDELSASLGLMTWKSAWAEIAQAEGWAEITLRRHVQTARVAELLGPASLKHPVFARTSGHVSVIDAGEVVDSWDSRCKRVKKVLVHRDDFAVALRILKQGA